MEFDLSANEALALCEEKGVPLDQLKTKRDLLYWLSEHEKEIGLDPVRILHAMFPTNPRNE